MRFMRFRYTWWRRKGFKSVRSHRCGFDREDEWSWASLADRSALQVGDEHVVNVVKRHLGQHVAEVCVGADGDEAGIGSRRQGAPDVTRLRQLNPMHSTDGRVMKAGFKRRRVLTVVGFRSCVKWTSLPGALCRAVKSATVRSRKGRSSSPISRAVYGNSHSYRSIISFFF